MVANGDTVEGIQGPIDALCAEVNATLNASLTAYFEDVEARHPFNWVVEFPEVFLWRRIGTFRQFLSLAFYDCLEDNARRQVWSRGPLLRAPAAGPCCGPLLRGVLQALEVPVLDETSAEGNLSAIHDLMADVRRRVAAAL